MSNFDNAFNLLIGNEGGYVNNSADPGGETNWGITQAVAVDNGYSGSMKLMQKETAKQIYGIRFGKPDGFDAYISTANAAALANPSTAIEPVIDADTSAEAPAGTPAAAKISPIIAALPGVMIFITSMCFNLVSDGLRQAMDVRL